MNQTELAQKLDMSERNLRDILAKLNLNHKTDSFDFILTTYIRHLRDIASGRQASEQRLKLDEAKTREALAGARIKELAALKEEKLILDKTHVREAIDGWIALAKAEYQNSIDKMLAMIESKHGVTIDRDAIDGIISSGLRTIADFSIESAGTD